MVKKEIFNKIEDIVLYLLGISIFLDYRYTKMLVPVVIILLLLRKILYKEKLECGNENIKKFIIFYIVVGTVWNFFGGMSYKPARNFLKMARYIPFLFFMYPIFKRDIGTLRRFLICSLISYGILLQKVIKEFIGFQSPWERAAGFEGISVTGDIGAMVSVFSFGLFISEKKWLKKIVYLVVFISGIFITIATQGRAPLLSVLLGAGFIIALEIYSKIELKKLLVAIGLIILVSFIGVKTIPESYKDRFETTFKTEKTIENTSNGLRLEMWKIGLKRVKENPVLGSGTKYDRDNLFRRFAEELPENTEVDRNYKYQLLNLGFNDAHSMYINAMVDNGIFMIVLFVVWFGIPGYLTLKFYKNLKEKRYFLGALGGIVSFLTIGAFWMLWRMQEQMYFWVLLVILLISVYKEIDES